MHHKVLGLLAVSLVLPELVATTQASTPNRIAIVGQATNLTVDNRVVQLNPQPEPPGSKAGASNNQ